ncbi:MAG: glycoside hydrolase family 31 protein [Myxococcaceae bacterium]|nr:glycoside hydrolase family 31 protein [Myxococcaceae bacterium]
MRLVFFALILAACSQPALDFASAALPIKESPEPPRHTPRWAFLPWVSKDISNGPDHREFVDGFIQRDIPIGVGVLDSPWETNYNTFVPNPARYPEFNTMVADLNAKGVRTVLWITSLVNETSFDAEMGGDTYVGASPNLAAGRRGRHFVDNGKTFLWWKGQGATVDFFKEDSVAWWHRQQDALLEAGVSGWKLDFGEEYAESAGFDTAIGTVTRAAYREAYYRDFLAYGMARRGRDEFTTMSRPYDKSYTFEGHFFARKEHCPIGWVGDNRRDWVGLADALDHLMRSAEAGYVVIGSDVGGYLDIDDTNLASPKIPVSQVNFVRWTAVAALTPFFQLHGRGNLAPWTMPERPDETVAIYRYWAKLHTQLVPFFYSLAEEAYANGGVIMHPMGNEADQWRGYQFVVGEAFLVAPILSDTGVRNVELPAGADWLDWWSKTSSPGGTTLTDYDSTDRARMPLFVRQGAIVPMDVRDDSTGLGTLASGGMLTVLWYPGTGMSRFVLHEEDDSTTVLGAMGRSLVMTRLVKNTKVRVLTSASGVSLNGRALPLLASEAALDMAAEGYVSLGATATVVKVPATTAEARLELTP